MLITISGTPGSGKSTLAQKLARHLGYQRIDIGELRRKAARARGLTLQEFNKLAERSPSLDRHFDLYQARIGKKGKRIVVEGRMSFYFIPQAIKVFLAASPGVAARRVFQQLKKTKSRPEEWYANEKALAQSITNRMRSDQKRFWKLYRVNPFLKKHYDLYLDTTKLSKRQMFERVLRFIQNHPRITTGEKYKRISKNS